MCSSVCQCSWIWFVVVAVGSFAFYRLCFRVVLCFSVCRVVFYVSVHVCLFVKMSFLVRSTVRSLVIVLLCVFSCDVFFAQRLHV